MMIPDTWPLNRRTFLQTAATLAASHCLSARSAEAAKPLVGSQLYGWGQYAQREGKMLNLPEVLSALRDAGYHYAEGNLGNAEANGKFAAQLREKGMEPVALYTGGALHEAGRAEKVAESLIANARGAKEAGFRVLNCNPNPIGRPKTDVELTTQARVLALIGGELAKFEMKFGIHHHTPEFANGAKEYHQNFRQTDAATVGFCYDVHWVFRGGVQPADALKEYGSRIVSWHLRQSREKIWWEDLDTGDIDYATIAAFAKANGITPIYSVELAIEGGTKITRSVVENHARSRAFVRSLFGA